MSHKSCIPRHIAAALLGAHRSTLYRALERSEEVSQADALAATGQEARETDAAPCSRYGPSCKPPADERRAAPSPTLPDT